MSTVPPSERTKKALNSLLAEGLVGDGDSRSEMVRLSVQHLVEQALDAVVRDVLGRAYCARRNEDQCGARNGYRQRQMKTAEGAVDFSVHLVRDVPNARIKELAGRLHGRTEELKALGVKRHLIGEAKSLAMTDYIPTRSWAGNQLYMHAAAMAHNLARELQMQTAPRTRGDEPTRPALWIFDKLERMRYLWIRRAGRLHSTNGKLILTMSANQVVRKDFERVVRGLAEAA